MPDSVVTLAVNSNWPMFGFLPRPGQWGPYVVLHQCKLEVHGFTTSTALVERLWEYTSVVTLMRYIFYRTLAAYQQPLVR